MCHVALCKAGLSAVLQLQNTYGWLNNVLGQMNDSTKCVEVHSYLIFGKLNAHPLVSPLSYPLLFRSGS